MQPRSSSSAGTRFLDRDAAIHSLEALSIALVAGRPDVVAVVLFGSLARGDWSARSDADLLVCLRSAGTDRPRDRVPQFLVAFLDAPIPVDVFPLTVAELSTRVEAGDRFWRRALSEGVLLAGKLPAPLQLGTPAEA